MNKIITISREFSSGGREVGKRLAETLKFAYYDKELIKKLASSGLSESYLDKKSQQYSNQEIPYEIGTSFVTYNQPVQTSIDSQIAQMKLLQEIGEKENAVIIGACADHALKEHKPFKVFIYASDINSKIKRCVEKDITGQANSNEAITKEIRIIDEKRAKYYKQNTNQNWADMANYNLCVDTSAVGVKGAVEIIINAFEKYDKSISY